MRRIILFLLLSAGVTSLFAQTDTTDNYVKQFMAIPQFKVHTVPDSAAYGNENLKAYAPFVLMFFSPDCEHCQKETKEILAYKKELKNLQILMVSAAPYQEIKDFYKSYDLASMPNIRLAQDVNIKLGRIYQVKTFPSIYVYDNRGILAKAYVGNIGIPAILEAVK